ncbi:uncharacterized protein G2W53_002664 [Senna tora]|uniref:Uncharacterized protein n=1 Tax=Senna tora TaxID=362788 RepID=A0A834X8I1_9FABA|nr:uncharacterized protein G2W53_002664 [Senna tora]
MDSDSTVKMSSQFKAFNDGPNLGH